MDIEELVKAAKKNSTEKYIQDLIKYQKTKSALVVGDV